MTAYNYDPDGHVIQTQQSASGTVLRGTSATYTLTGKPATTTDANMRGQDFLARRMGGAQRYPSRRRSTMLACPHDRLSSQLHCRGQLLLHRQSGGAAVAVVDATHR